MEPLSEPRNPNHSKARRWVGENFERLARMLARRSSSALALAALLAAGCATAHHRAQSRPVGGRRAASPPGRSVAEVLSSLGPTVEPRLKERFASAGVPYPPARAYLLAFKTERQFELWAPAGDRMKRVANYPLLDNSGTIGPKLREGDEQIPEGVYRVVWLHPNSHYHLSMKLDYPNAFDRARAREDGRRHPGGDIFIHGGDVSIGCLAVGDPAIEELFVLSARIGSANTTTIIAPWDLRHRPPPDLVGDHAVRWLPELYADLATALAAFR